MRNIHDPVKDDGNVRMRYKIISFIAILTLFVVISGCGKYKRNIIARTYHNTTAHYNGYYNAKIRIKDGVSKLEESFRIIDDNYLPVLYFGPKDFKPETNPKFDEAIKKCDVVIYKHPRSKWIDDCRLLMGKAWFYKRNFPYAIDNLKFVIDSFPDSKRVPEAYIWLAMAHYYNGNGIIARQIIDMKLSDYPLTKRLKGELALLQATFLIEDGEFDAAIETLESNWKNIKGRMNRARTLYLLGQVYMNQDKFAQSYDYFKKVTKTNADYEVVFAAKMMIAKLLVKEQPKDANNGEVFKYLKKLLRDEKNLEYRDQVYYQMALLELKKENKDAAIDLLQQSVKYSTSNPRQKCLSYYQLGQLFFKDKKFETAQSYYDSAAAVVTPEIPEYQEIKMIAKTLKEYVNCLHNIEYQDSMLALSKLSPQQLEKVIAQVIETEKKKEEEQQQQLLDQVAFLNNPDLFLGSNDNKDYGSGFYFDNLGQVSSGRLEFQKVWGLRKLEDHWRRSTKELNIVSNEQDQPSSDTISKELKDKYGEKAKYYKDIPKNEEQVFACHEIIEDNLFKLAQIYQSKLNVPDSSINVYKRLLARYPETDYSLKSRFALYKMLLDKGDPEAAVYKNYILINAPNSIFAKLVNNIDMSKEDTPDAEFNSAYSAMYNTFSDEDYQTAITFADFMAEKYLDNKRIANVLYMKGLSYGHLGNKDSLRSVFLYVKQNFPQSEVIPFIDGTLAKLAGEDKPVQQDTKKDGNKDGKDPVKNQDVPKENDKRFDGFSKTIAPGEKLIVLMYIKRTSLTINDLKTIISNFNKANFPSENLTVSTFLYKDSHYMVYINAFGTTQLASEYMGIAVSDEGIRKLLLDPADRCAYITPKNFALAYGQKRLEDYLLYYDLFIERKL